MQHQDPAFWLVLELDGELTTVNPTALSSSDSDLGFLEGVVRGFHEAHPEHGLVTISDLIDWLAHAGLGWARLDLTNDVARAMSVGGGAGT